MKCGVTSDKPDSEGPPLSEGEWGKMQDTTGKAASGNPAGDSGATAEQVGAMQLCYSGFHRIIQDSVQV